MARCGTVGVRSPEARKERALTVERIVAPRRRRIGRAEVDRVLPVRERRMVGPFIFADLIGPDELDAGRGVDVPVHPHIGLATVTYLFAGALDHRDSTGVVQRIEPGGVNWMTAGRGVAHSERSPADQRAPSTSIAGLQTWVALPDEDEELEPSFQHAGTGELPELKVDGATIRLLVGTGFGERSPVPGASPLVHADVHLDDGVRLGLPAEHPDRGVLVIDGDVEVDGTTIPPRHVAVVAPGDAIVTALGPARIVTFGGEPVGPRRIWWNFVSSRQERIEAARADWAARRFDPVPGDTERVELP